MNRASLAVKQLTALSRLESTAQAFTQRVNVYAIVQQVLESYTEQLTARNLTVSVNDCHPVIQGNVDMIAILIDNLVRNALNHANEGTQVSIALSEGAVTQTPDRESMPGDLRPGVAVDHPAFLPCAR